MSDIRPRLRNLGKSLQGYDNAKADLLIAAAQEIGRLRRQVKKLEAEKKPKPITPEEMARRLGGVLRGVMG